MTEDETSDHIWDELCLARDAWTQLNQLRVKEHHRAILNGCAPWFFGRVQVAFFREVILAISRLTDRPTSGKFENLSIARLLDDPRIDKHDGLRDELTVAVKAAETAAAPIRPARDKVIAHFDRETKQLRSLTAPTDGEIETALAALEHASGLHASRVRDRSWSFEMAMMGDAKTLVDVLENSQRWQTLKRLQEQEQKGLSQPAPCLTGTSGAERDGSAFGRRHRDHRETHHGAARASSRRDRIAGFQRSPDRWSLPAEESSGCRDLRPEERVSLHPMHVLAASWLGVR